MTGSTTTTTMNDEPVSDKDSTADRSRGLLTNKNHVPTRSWLQEASERAFLQKQNVRPVIGEASMAGGVAKPSPPQRSTRRLGEEDIVPGRGWYASGWKNTRGKHPQQFLNSIGLHPTIFHSPHHTFSGIHHLGHPE
eukprot:scaffold479844_cov145-Attheya_sp.AAC.1